MNASHAFRRQSTRMHRNATLKSEQEEATLEAEEATHEKPTTRLANMYRDGQGVEEQ